MDKITKEKPEQMADDERRESFIRAGRIIGEVREETKKRIKPGISLLELANWIEEQTIKKGGFPGFPANLSLNDTAAHSSPEVSDKTVLKETDVLKVDIGCHINGWVADTAYTISFDKEKQPLISATEKALNEALKLCTPGRKISDISTVIEETIRGAGFRPIVNLTGHGLGQYVVHEEPAIPNVSFKSGAVLPEGGAFALEPFATDGAGKVKDSEQILIFREGKPVAVRNADARKIQDWVAQFEGLPFPQRWIEQQLGITGFKLRLALKELLDREGLYGYPALMEAGKGMVAQFEHSVLVEDKPVVITRV
jgi:methionyl aminopeptidase